MSEHLEITELDAYRLQIEPSGRMRVPGIVFASRALLPDPRGDKALEQVSNVAPLPGIVAASYAMPDVHWGYGFPMGSLGSGNHFLEVQAVDTIYDEPAAAAFGLCRTFTRLVPLGVVKG